MSLSTRSLVLCALLSTFSACAIDSAPDLGVAQSALHGDPYLTPGSLCTDQDKDFDGYRYAEQTAHCRRNVTTSRKNRIYDAYGIPAADRNGYEVDHRISLFAGGDNSNANLWPLPHDDARRKAEFEEEHYQLLLHGEMTQADVVDALLGWQ